MNLKQLVFGSFFSKKIYSQSLFARKNDLALRIAVVFFALALPYVFIFGFLKMVFVQAIVIMTILFFGLSIFSNKLKWYSLSKALLIIGPTISFFLCANILGPAAGAQLLLFTLISLPLLFFDRTQIIWVLVCVGFPMCAYLYSVVTSSSYAV